MTKIGLELTGNTHDEGDEPMSEEIDEVLQRHGLGLRKAPIVTTDVFDDSVTGIACEMISKAMHIPHRVRLLLNILYEMGMTDPEIIYLLWGRAVVGKKKYGGFLMPNNGRDAKKDFTEEVLDAINYAVQIELEEKK
jgi:hypothetical protein